jgi:hypothetical protein
MRLTNLQVTPTTTPEHAPRQTSWWDAPTRGSRLDEYAIDIPGAANALSPVSCSHPMPLPGVCACGTEGERLGLCRVTVAESVRGEW